MGKKDTKKLGSFEKIDRHIDKYIGIDNNKDSNISTSNIDKGISPLKGFPLTEDGMNAKKLFEIVGDNPGSERFHLKLVREGKIPFQVLEDLAYETRADVERQKNTDDPIRNPGRVFNWKVQQWKRDRK